MHAAGRDQIVEDADQLIAAAGGPSALLEVCRAVVDAQRGLEGLAGRYPPDLVEPERLRLAGIRSRIREQAAELLRVERSKKPEPDLLSPQRQS